MLPIVHGYITRSASHGVVVRRFSWVEEVFFKTLIPWQQVTTMVFFLATTVATLYRRNQRVTNLADLTNPKRSHMVINLCLTGSKEASPSVISRNLFVWTHIREQVKNIHKSELVSSVNFSQALLVLVLSICSILQFRNVDTDSGISMGMAMLGFDLCLFTLAIFVTLLQGYYLNSSLDNHQWFLKKGKWLLNTELLKGSLNEEERRQMEVIDASMQAGADYIAANAESPTIFGWEISSNLILVLAGVVMSVLESTFFPGSDGWVDKIWQRIFGG
jgi:hypothetical protein